MILIRSSFSYTRCLISASDSTLWNFSFPTIVHVGPLDYPSSQLLHSNILTSTTDFFRFSQACCTCDSTSRVENAPFGDTYPGLTQITSPISFFISWLVFGCVDVCLAGVCLHPVLFLALLGILSSVIEKESSS